MEERGEALYYLFILTGVIIINLFKETLMKYLSCASHSAKCSNYRFNI